MSAYMQLSDAEAASLFGSFLIFASGMMSMMGIVLLVTFRIGVFIYTLFMLSGILFLLSGIRMKIDTSVIKDRAPYTETDAATADSGSGTDEAAPADDLVTSSPSVGSSASPDENHDKED